MNGSPNDGRCLRYPEPLPFHADINVEQAAHMLLNALHQASQTPFQWSYIDKPADGSLVLLYLPPGSIFPIDGIRWGEGEARYLVPVVIKNQQTEIEVFEAKFGFAPGSMDTSASRVRKRFRLTRAGHPNLTLVHYGRGMAVPVNPAMHQPMRPPLQAIQMPPVYVFGERAGQRPGAGPAPGMLGMPAGMSGAAGSFNMLQSQSASMAEMEHRRREQDRLRQAREKMARQVRPEEEPDEDEVISIQNLAMARYRRNHEWMSEVFSHAAHGPVEVPTSDPDFGVFDLKDLEERKEKVEKEIEELKNKPRFKQKEADVTADISMNSETT